LCSPRGQHRCNPRCPLQQSKVALAHQQRRNRDRVVDPCQLLLKFRANGITSDSYLLSAMLSKVAFEVEISGAGQPFPGTQYSQQQPMAPQSLTQYSQLQPQRPMVGMQYPSAAPSPALTGNTLSPFNQVETCARGPEPHPNEGQSSQAGDGCHVRC